MAPGPISSAYVIKLSYQSVCLYISLSLLSFPRQWRMFGGVGFYAIKGKRKSSHSQNFLIGIPNNLIETVKCNFTFNNLALEKVSVCPSGSSFSTQYWSRENYYVITSVSWIYIYIRIYQVKYFGISHKQYWSNKRTLSLKKNYYLLVYHLIVIAWNRAQEGYILFLKE
jgi:hypothetical protein